jgi:flagellar hook-associated protein 3 FlgL
LAPAKCQSSNYAGLGDSRGLAISLQSQLEQIANYDSVIKTVGVRLSTAQTALGAIANSAQLVQTTAVNSHFTLTQNGQTADQESANGQLQQVIDALNTQIGNDYIFSGSASNKPSVASLTDIFNGIGSEAGLNQVVAERAQADLGSNGLGRLVIPPAASSAAAVTGSGAALWPDAVASVAGAQDIASLSSAGGTLIINGQPVTVNAGDNATAILADINGATGTTGVSASLDSGNHLVLQSSNAVTAISIGGGSSASVLALAFRLRPPIRQISSLKARLQTPRPWSSLSAPIRR